MNHLPDGYFQFQNKNGGGFISTIGLKKVFKFSFNRNKRVKTPVKQQHVNPLAMELKSRSKKGKSSRIGTSGSEVSEMRAEHILSTQNRNSSSGYVFYPLSQVSLKIHVLRCAQL
jgi:hypothetical protein